MLDSTHFYPCLLWISKNWYTCMLCILPWLVQESLRCLQCNKHLTILGMGTYFVRQFRSCTFQEILKIPHNTRFVLGGLFVYVWFTESRYFILLVLYVFQQWKLFAQSWMTPWKMTQWNRLKLFAAQMISNDTPSTGSSSFFERLNDEIKLQLQPQNDDKTTRTTPSTGSSSFFEPFERLTDEAKLLWSITN